MTLSTDCPRRRAASLYARAASSSLSKVPTHFWQNRATHVEFCRCQATPMYREVGTRDAAAPRVGDGPWVLFPRFGAGAVPASSGPGGAAPARPRLAPATGAAAAAALGAALAAEAGVFGAAAGAALGVLVGADTKAGADSTTQEGH